MSAGIGSCDYCGAIASVAINCGCGFRVAYCGEDCRELGAMAIEAHAEDCEHAGRATTPTPAEVLQGWRQLERLAAAAPTSEPVVSLELASGGAR